MPIVNGTYVNDTLFPGDSSTRNQSGWIEQAFGPGKFSSKDWSDTKTAAYNYLLKQQEQAYNLELWNLQNEYNSPAAQMKRYQDAGLNPNLIYGQSNEAPAPASASASPFRSGGTQSKKTANAINMINSFGQIVKQAKDIYDYATYGAPERQVALDTARWNQNLIIQRGQAQAYENMWQQYMLGLMEPGTAVEIANSPRGKMQSVSYDLKQSQIDRLEAYIKMIPDQQARTAALTALDHYRLKILQGQNDAVLNLSTGNETADAFLRAFIYFGMSKF